MTASQETGAPACEYPVASGKCGKPAKYSTPQNWETIRVVCARHRNSVNLRQASERGSRRLWTCTPLIPTMAQTQEWLRALKSQAQQMSDRNKVRVPRGFMPSSLTISPEEILRLIELIQASQAGSTPKSDVP